MDRILVPLYKHVLDKEIMRKYLLTMGHERISNLSDAQCKAMITCEDSRLRTFSQETYKHVVLVLFCL